MSPAASIVSNDASFTSLGATRATRSSASSKASSNQGATGDLSPRVEAAEISAFATTRFINDDAEPYVPAGICDLGADPSSFLDVSHRPTNMALKLETLMLPFGPTGTATAGVAVGNGDVPNGQYMEHASFDQPPADGEGADSDSLLSLSDDEGSTEEEDSTS